MLLGLAIAGLGARCSIGLTAPAAAAAAAGALNRFQFDERIRSGRTGAAITCAWLETLPDRWMGVERMHALAVAAADETLAAEEARRLTQAPLPVLLAVPAPRPGFEEREAAGLARNIMRALPVDVDESSCSMVIDGHAGGAKLLLEAKRLLADGAAASVLLGGVESYRDLDALRYIERTGRLRTEDDPLGWIPGEGAGFLLLTTAAHADRARLSPLATIEAAAIAEEPHPWYTGRPTIGTGLTEALREVLDVNGILVEVYGDLNGEPWRADEWGYAYLRTARHFVEPLAITHPADCWGDVGAASVPMLVALAAEHMIAERAVSSRALVFTSSDTTALRAACTVRPGGVFS